MTSIPYDMYESDQEIVVILPLGGVQKESISISVQHEALTLQGKRNKPQLRKGFHPVQEQCFWGDIELYIDLPPHTNYKQIHSSLSKENILTLIVPKNTLPDKIPVSIE